METTTRRGSISLLLMAGLLSCAGCQSKPPLSTSPDGRGCYLGLLAGIDVPSVRAWAPDAQAGDLLVNASCDADQTERELNHIRRNTR